MAEVTVTINVAEKPIPGEWTGWTVLVVDYVDPNNVVHGEVKDKHGEQGEEKDPDQGSSTPGGAP